MSGNYPAPNLDGEIVYISPPNMTSSFINSMSQSLAAAGGGVIQFPPGNYAITAPIQVLSGITFKGAGWTVTNYVSYPDNKPGIGNGTWLIGNGTFHCFSANSVDGSGPYASSALFSNAGITQCSIEDIGISNFLDGVHIGSNYNPGAFFSNFKNICALQCQGWGFWFENMLHVRYDRLYSFGCVTGQHRYKSSATSAILEPVNCACGEIGGWSYLDVNSTSRNIVIDCANGTAGGLAAIQILQSCSYAGFSTPSQAATMSNGSANIIVANSSVYAVGMPLTFSANANGFTKNRVYFVLTNNTTTNTITVATNTPYGGTAIAATGNSAVNIICGGFPHLELVRTDTTAGNIPALYRLDQMDIESPSVAAIVIDSADLFSIESQVLTAVGTQAYCLRNLTGQVGYLGMYGNQNIESDGTHKSIVVDWNNGSANQPNTYSSGAASFLGFQGNNGSAALYLSTSGVVFQASLQNIVSPSGLDWTYAALPICQCNHALDSTAFTLTSNYAGVVTYNNAGAATWTLPTPGSSYVGLEFEVVATASSGGVTLSAGSPGFNLVGTRTAITINPGASLKVKMCQTFGGTWYWAVLAVGGAYSAGTVSTV